ncbi:MAG: SRPBCC domain-containing protein [Myxococcota bacterium]
MALPPVTKSVAVSCGPFEAWTHFTAGLAGWWPLDKQSVFGAEAESCVFEARAGGRIFERSVAGGEALWGAVLLVEPGRRVAFAWHPGRPPHTAQEVRVHFVASEGGTRVELEHVGWESLGERAEETRKAYETGWDITLQAFAACVHKKHRPHHLP